MTGSWRRWLRQRRPASLRARLLLGTWVAIAVALLLTGLALTRYFTQYARSDLTREAVSHLNQLTSLLSVDAHGVARLDAQRLLEPDWSRPYSGMYWQINNPAHQPTLRSRSLWDEHLQLAQDLIDSGVVHHHTMSGPDGQTVLIVERGVRLQATGNGIWRVIVAMDTHSLQQSVSEFRHFTLWALAILLALLTLAAGIQVHVGLAPLRSLQAALKRLHQGLAQDLGEGFPNEVQPLVTDFNHVLQRQRDMVTRARQQAGNLAHGLKTPLAVIRQAAQSAPPDDALARLTLTQIEAARRQVDWHLARARAQSVQQEHGVSCNVPQALSTITQTMAMIHRDRGLALDLDWDNDALAFAGDAQDLQEILGNLVDNAYQWAHNRVWVSAAALTPQRLQVQIADDGPGLTPEQMARVRQRGQRLDENVPGSGLGLAIAEDLTRSYGGRLELSPRNDSGLCVRLTLPRSPDSA